MTSKSWIYGAMVTAVVIIVAVLILTARELPKPESALQEIKMAYFPAQGHAMYLPILIAQEKGFFEEEGLKVEFEKISPIICTQALLARDVDYITSHGGPVIAAVEGAPLKVVMVFSRYFLFSIATRSDIKIDDIKKVGTLFPGSTMHYHSLSFIEKYNLDAGVVTTGGDIEVITALLHKGEVDAVVHEAIPSLRLQTEGGIQVLDFFDKEILPTILFTREEKIENNPEQVQKVILALQKAIEFIKTNPEETKKFTLKHWNLEKTEENLQIVEKAYPYFVTAYDLESLSWKELEEGLRRVVQFAKAGAFKTLEDIEKQVVTQEDMDRVFDFRFVDYKSISSK